MIPQKEEEKVLKAMGQSHILVFKQKSVLTRKVLKILEDRKIVYLLYKNKNSLKLDKLSIIILVGKEFKFFIEVRKKTNIKIIHLKTRKDVESFSKIFI